jgi:hypothetical protein
MKIVQMVVQGMRIMPIKRGQSRHACRRPNASAPCAGATKMTEDIGVNTAIATHISQTIMRQKIPNKSTLVGRMDFSAS